jgi:hypothetical protein
MQPQSLLFVWSVAGVELKGCVMGLLRRKAPLHSIAVHPDNIANKDWIVVLEAGTIVGPSPTKLRVARATQERTVVKKRNIFLKVQYFLVVESFNPRVHAVYFCPQLYRYDADKKLVPLQGEEIGTLIAQSVAGGVADRRPWYEPSEQIPSERMISGPAKVDFDTVVVDMAGARGAAS